MNNILIDFTKEYGLEIIHSIVMGILSYIVIDIKKVYKKYIQDKTKKDVVKMVCRYIDEVYPSTTGDEKLNLVFNSTKEILKEKGITISDLELKVLLHNSIYLMRNELEVKE